MPDLAVTTAFDAKGDILKALKKIDTRVDKFGNSAQRAFKKANKGANSFKTVMKGVLAAGLVTKGLDLMRRGLTATATEFLSFDQSITSAAAKFKDVNLQTAEGRLKFEQLKKSARDVGATTEFSAGQAAQGLKFMSLAAFTSEQAMANLRNLTNLATSAEIDLARASDIATDSLGAFGLMTDDTAQLEKNFTRQNDVMALAMARSNVGAEEFFETVQRSAATFTATGQRLETFATLTGIMADAGKKGGEAGTTLNNMMLRLAKPTGDAARAIERLGIKVRDENGDFNDIVDILADVKKGTADMGTAQRAAALDLIFGKRAITGVNILLEKGIPAIREYRTEMDNAAGSSQKMADIMRFSLTNQLAGLRSAAIEVGFQLFEAFSGEGSNAITALTERVRQIDMKPVIEGIRETFSFFQKVFEILAPFSGAITVLVGAWIAYSVAIKAVAVAQGIMNAVMLANPVSLVIIAIVSLVAAGVALVQNWKKVKTFFVDTFKFIEDKIKIFTANPIFKLLFGGGGGQVDIAEGAVAAGGFNRQSPQQKEAAARAQQLTLNQQIDINGAAPGTTAESKTTAAPQLSFAGVGANTKFN